MTTEFVDVDVRPILRAGGERFSVIMQAVEGLEPGQVDEVDTAELEQFRKTLK